MILKVKVIFAGLFVSGLVMPRWGMAYELGTHARLTQKAYERSILGNPQTGPTLLKELGIDSAKISPFGDTYYDVSGSDIRQRKVDPFEARFMPVGAEETLTLPAWLMRGAIREDDVPFGENPMDDPVNAVRVLNHFYDPIHDRPLTVLVPLGEKAPDWGLGTFDVFKNPNEENFNRSNHYTIPDAREAMYRALTGRKQDGSEDEHAKTKKDRDKYWATAFRALGDVVHLIQDMAQPQHTRNDALAFGVHPTRSLI